MSYKDTLHAATQIKSVFDKFFKPATEKGLFQTIVSTSTLMDNFGTQEALKSALDWLKGQGVLVELRQRCISPPCYYGNDTGRYESVYYFSWA